MKDILGITIEVGDLVTFPTRVCNDADLRLAKVVGVEGDQPVTRSVQKDLRKNEHGQWTRYHYWGAPRRPNPGKMLRLDMTPWQLTEHLDVWEQAQ